MREAFGVFPKMGVPSDPSFWGPAFGFLTALTGAIRWLLKVTFVYRQRSNLQKARLESDVQKMKEDHLQKSISAIRDVIDKIIPVIEAHTKKLEDVDKMHAETLQMMKELKIQYGDFHSRIEKAQAGGGLIIKRLENIETEVINMKNGYILVATKKTSESK